MKPTPDAWYEITYRAPYTSTDNDGEHWVGGVNSLGVMTHGRFLVPAYAVLTPCGPPVAPEPTYRSVAIDTDGDAWQKRVGGWYLAGTDVDDPRTWADLNETWGPIKIVYRPEDED